MKKTKRKTITEGCKFISKWLPKKHIMVGSCVWWDIQGHVRKHKCSKSDSSGKKQSHPELQTERIITTQNDSHVNIQHLSLFWLWENCSLFLLSTVNNATKMYFFLIFSLATIKTIDSKLPKTLAKDNTLIGFPYLFCYSYIHPSYQV